MVRDLSTAEDLAHDALVAALEQWPEQGIPRNPGAWLMAAAKHRAIDGLRRRTPSPASTRSWPVTSMTVGPIRPRTSERHGRRYR